MRFHRNTILTQVERPRKPNTYWKPRCFAGCEDGPRNPPPPSTLPRINGQQVGFVIMTFVQADDLTGVYRAMPTLECLYATSSCLCFKAKGVLGE